MALCVFNIRSVIEEKDGYNRVRLNFEIMCNLTLKIIFRNTITPV